MLIHLIGQKPGSVADSAAVAEYLASVDKDSGFLRSYPGLRAALGDFSGITYTQWEVLIALHLGITVFVYGDPTHADPAHPQRAHLDRLVAARRYSDTFTDEADLKDKIWADLMFYYRQSLPAAQVPEIFKPSNIPGIYSGSLFLGREDFLRDLRSSLLKKTHATAITHTAAATGIAGLGGIGKTHAAVEYACRNQANYTATLFVSGDSPERLDAGFSALFDTLRLGTSGDVERDQSVRITAVKNWFNSNRDWLLIVDNVDDKAAAGALTGCFGSLTHGHVLITSCLQNWGSSVETLNIEVLSTEDSSDLLLQLTEEKRRRTDDEASQVRRLAELLEGLPLALHQAAGYIKEQRLTFADYIAHYEEEAAGVLDWFESHIIPYERPDMLARKPVLITWKTSFDKLDADTRFWLLVFAHFAPDPIPEFLLDSAPEAPDEVKTRHRAALKAIAQAETYSLLTRYDDPPRFKLHRLVQHIIRLTASEADRTAALAMGIQLFDENDLGNPTDVRTWPRWNPVQAHAGSLVAHAPEEVALNRLSWFLSELGLLLKSKALYQRAEALYRRALVIDENVLGRNHYVVAIRLNNLAMLLRETNGLVEAEELMRRVASIDEAIYGRDSPEFASRLNNLAEILKVTNRVVEAEEMMVLVLEVFETCYGSIHPEVARSLNNLGDLYRATKRFDKSEELLRRALRVTEEVYGSDHPKVALPLNNLGVLLHALKQFDEAESLEKRALDINVSSLGLEHPDVARQLNNLALLLQATSRLAEAEPLMRRAFGIFVRSQGLEHPNSQGVGGNYIILLQALEVPEAEIEERVKSAVAGG